MENKKEPPANVGGVAMANMMPEKESIYYMKCALWWHYKDKYPENETLVTEICEMVGNLLGAEKPQGAGGVGMIRGWMDQILEIESSQRSAGMESTHKG